LNISCYVLYRIFADKPTYDIVKVMKLSPESKNKLLIAFIVVGSLAITYILYSTFTSQPGTDIPTFPET